MKIQTFTPRNIKEITTKYPTYNHIIKRIDKDTAYFLISSESPLTLLDFETTDFSEFNYPSYDSDEVEIITATKNNNIVQFNTNTDDPFGFQFAGVQIFNGNIH